MVGVMTVRKEAAVLAVDVMEVATSVVLAKEAAVTEAAVRAAVASVEAG